MHSSCDAFQSSTQGVVIKHVVEIPELYISAGVVAPTPALKPLDICGSQVRIQRVPKRHHGLLDDRGIHENAPRQRIQHHLDRNMLITPERQFRPDIADRCPSE
jgi:hypothetical protein